MHYHNQEINKKKGLAWAGFPAWIIFYVLEQIQIHL